MLYDSSQIPQTFLSAVDASGIYGYPMTFDDEVLTSQISVLVMTTPILRVPRDHTV